MSSVKEAIEAIVDYNFERNFSRTMQKSVDVTRSYSLDQSPDYKFDMLDEIVKDSGLSSVKRSLGGHPDFNHLSGDITADSTITTMFADLRNFTRYGLFFTPKQIRFIKKAVISSFIYIVHAFDGHVHNIPGDGLMVYFGGKNEDDEESALNAIIAGSSLLYALESYINPLLIQEYEFEERLHMRVGIEFGNVIWGQYGIRSVEEVKATGFSVDFAAKIQQQADTDALRIGESIREKIEFSDDFFSNTRVYSKQLKRVQKSVRHYDFDWRRALKEYSDSISKPLQQTLEIGKQEIDNQYYNPKTRSLFSNQLPSSNRYSSKIIAKISPKKGGPFKEIYNSNRKLPKFWWIKFHIDHNVPIPFEIEWEAVNNGYEAFTAHNYNGDLGHINTDASDKTVAYEQTAYKGTHYMVCRILKDGHEVSRAYHAVLVK